MDKSLFFTDVLCFSLMWRALKEEEKGLAPVK